ncbi:hypothetical protein [Acinetobacter sp. MD2(2019)]|uniref:hypothetical protein n=1 Tax=Acinetobacter sp. MD2(2019) TaxID=2605273 RepID=UPI002D1ECBA9|nr:hypothetical protein [Acinetobacter sp. MD2(2019)]MEB3754113.1 hypothetical protein [Acinetobacter sp. MD2(2019)]
MLKIALIALVVMSIVLLLVLVRQSKRLLNDVQRQNAALPKHPRPRQLHPKLKQQQK